MYASSVLGYLAAAGFDISVLWLTESPSAHYLFLRPYPSLPYPANVFIQGWVRVGSTAVPGYPLALRNLYRTARGKLLQLQRKPTEGRLTESKFHGSTTWYVPAAPREIHAVARACDRVRPDVVILNYAFLANALDDVPRHTFGRSAILTHDLIHQRFASIPSEENPHHWSRELEARYLSRADIIIAIQENERLEFSRMVPGACVLSAPMAYPVNVSPGERAAGRCLFIGDRADHNIDALHWLLGEIWPRILDLHPSATLDICGGVGAYAASRPKGVNIHGIVTDLTPYYASAEVCFVPLRFGSGLKIKLVEALARGKAVVTTGLGAEGLESFSGSAFLQADDANAFAKHTSSILSDSHLRADLEVCAAQLARSRFESSKCYGRLVEVLRDSHRITNFKAGRQDAVGRTEQ